MPASLWAKSTMTTRLPSRYRLSRPGERSASGAKCDSPSRTSAIVAPEPACATGRGEGVGDVVAGQAADRDRHVGDVDDRGLGRAIGLDERAVAHQVGAAAALAVASHGGGRVAVQGEQRDPGPNPTRDRGDERVVGVEHDPAVRPA